MALESVVWTVLPNGRDPDDPGLLRATVFVSPRLSTDGAGSRTLDEYPSFADWPKALTELKFEVEFDGVGSDNARLDPRIGKPDSDLWRLLFFGGANGAVGVVDREFVDHSEQVINSFPADELANDILALYDGLAVQHPSSFPPVTTGLLADLADAIGGIGDGRHKRYGRLSALIAQESSEIFEGRHGRYLRRDLVPPAARRELSYLQAYRFYDRFAGGEALRDRTGKIDPAAVPPRPKPPEIDFHGYVGALGDYPVLLRRLGIAIDVTVPDRSAYGTSGRIRLILAGNPQPFMIEPTANPWLHYLRTDRLFLPQPRAQGPVADGQLNLRSDWHAVHQIDIDGSVLKTTNVAATAARLKAHLAATKPSMTPDACSVPALQSAGYTVIRRDRAAAVVAQLDHSAKHDHDEGLAQPIELFAEDVTRGYRTDVEADLNGDFRSLCRRVGSYEMQTANGPVPIDIGADEGYTKAASTTSVPGESELYLHEAVTSWNGWSQVAKRPGATVDPDEVVQEPPPEIDAGLPLVTSFAAEPGSLTRLRYGTPYRLRVRLVDLAGNSVDPKAIDDTRVSGEQPFWRWEPVPSPVVTPRRPYAEGESQLRMVIRSTFGMQTDAYVALPRIAGLTGHTDPTTAYLPECDRWLSAPKTAQQMAEFYGVFDDAIGLGLPAAAVDAAFAIAAKEQGVLADEVAADALSLPYLPDVSGRGVAFTSLPNDPLSAPTRTQAWPADDAANRPWWDRQPFRIRIVEGSAPSPVTPAGAPSAPDWNEDKRLLTVFLPQAEMVTVRLSSYLADGDLAIFGLWARIAAGMNPAQAKAAVQGRTWMLTPWSELVLVHAVEKPLLEPVVDVPATGMQRERGETFCALAGSIDNHAKSTGRIDVDAVWDEQVDDLAQDAPDDGIDGRPVRHGHSHVGDFGLVATEDDCKVGRDDQRAILTAGGQVLKPALHRLRHELGDTRHRLVNYRATATTRFREYFPPEIISGVGDDGERLIERRGPEASRHVPSSRRPDPPEVAYVIPTFSWSQATTRRKSPIGGPLAVPTTTRTRRSGLRVYLKRPWYSSGDGELLGVVLRDQPHLTWRADLAAGLTVSEAVGAAADLAAQRLFDRNVIKAKGAAALSASGRLVAAAGVAVTAGGAFAVAAGQQAPDRVTAFTQLATGLSMIDTDLGPILVDLFGGMDPDKLRTQWGSDPLWGSATPGAGPYIHHFPLRTAVQTGLSLAETGKAKVTVVGHTPQYDPERRLWFCDLQLDAGASYTPFVRLGLCRYQQHSIADCHISRVVTADFAQILPERAASFTARAESVGVSVTGPAGYSEVATAFTTKPVSTFGMGLSRRVSAVLQRLPEGADPDLGWTAVGAEVDLAPAVGDSGLGSVRWSGTVPLAGVPAGSKRRVLVTEHEILETDPDSDDPLDATRELRGGPVEFPTIRQVRERLVYADHLEIT